MNREKDIFHLAEIIARSFGGNLDADEQVLLDGWLSVSERNRQKYKVLQKREFLEKRFTISSQIKWQDGYEVFVHSRMKQQKRRRIQQIVGYAAVFIMLLGIAAVFYWTNKEVKPVISIAKVYPVSKNAILTLAEGERIELSDSNLSLLKNQGGVDVTVEGNVISYLGKGDSVTIKKKPLYNMLQIPRGGEYFLTLGDGTRVWLNAESEIRYPVEFTDAKRVVYVDGEAYFEVTKDEAKPFVVMSSQAQVTVLGTSFNFRSYPEEDEVVITLESGSVSMYSKTEQQEILLEPGEQGTLNKESGRLSKQEVETYLYSAWKDGRFVFRDTRLEELFNILSRWYDLQVFYLNQDAKDIRFTGDIDKTENFESILKIIENNERVIFSVNERTVSVQLQ